MEGYAPFHAPGLSTPARTWYKVWGDLRWVQPGRRPLIVMHGGPGACHEYLLPLSQLYHSHRIPVILYDQIGEGRSTDLRAAKGDDPAFWTAALFAAELDNLVDHLGLRAAGFDFLGQSWGGMLGSWWAARRPKGLRRLILADAPASTALFSQGINRLLTALPKGVQQAIEHARKNGEYESDAYKEAVQVFYNTNLCRVQPWPAELLASLVHLEEGYVYKLMQGPSEMDCTGVLKDWTTVEDAAKINVPTLLINAQYDEATDESMQPFFERIPRVRWATIDDASHMCHIEKPARYTELVTQFLIDD